MEIKRTFIEFQNPEKLIMGVDKTKDEGLFALSKTNETEHTEGLFKLIDSAPINRRTGVDVFSRTLPLKNDIENEPLEFEVIRKPATSSTTQALGEEGGGTSNKTPIDNNLNKPIAKNPNPTMTTMALGEEGGSNKTPVEGVDKPVAKDPVNKDKNPVKENLDKLVGKNPSITTQALGEEGGSTDTGSVGLINIRKPKKSKKPNLFIPIAKNPTPTITTQALGEEGGNANKTPIEGVDKPVAKEPVNKDENPVGNNTSKPVAKKPTVTTQALGEEGGGTGNKTPIGNNLNKPIAKDPVNKDKTPIGNNLNKPIAKNPNPTMTTMALGEEGGGA